MNFKEELINYISLEILELDELLDENENLLADGMVDSLGMLRLVGYIEANWHIKIPPQDFIIQNFRSVNALVTYLTPSINARAD